MNLELYRIFYVVAEMKNITKASEILNISQPAVTKHIKNLEDQLGTPLFIRTKKGVVLNEYGKKIFVHIDLADAILLCIDAVQLVCLAVVVDEVSKPLHLLHRWEVIRVV